MKSKSLIIAILWSLLIISVTNSSNGQEITKVNPVEQSDEKLSKENSESNKIEVSIDQDLLTFVKAAFWIAGIFLAIISFIGIAFFGFDVRNARKHLSETKKELEEKSELLKDLFDKLMDDKQTLEKNREKFENYIKQAEETIEQLGTEIEGITTLKEETLSDSKTETIKKSINKLERDDQSLLREVILNSSFEWTSLKRIMAKTGFSRDKIMEIARNNPAIEISIGKKTKDHIFKLK